MFLREAELVRRHAAHAYDVRVVDRHVKPRRRRERGRRSVDLESRPFVILIVILYKHGTRFGVIFECMIEGFVSIKQI